MQIFVQVNNSFFFSRGNGKRGNRCGKVNTWQANGYAHANCTYMACCRCLNLSDSIKSTFFFNRELILRFEGFLVGN